MTRFLNSDSELTLLYVVAGLDTEGEGGCSSHTEGCDGSTGTILPAAVEKTAVI